VVTPVSSDPRKPECPHALLSFWRFVFRSAIDPLKFDEVSIKKTSTIATNFLDRRRENQRILATFAEVGLNHLTREVRSEASLFQGFVIDSKHRTYMCRTIGADSTKDSVTAFCVNATQDSESELGVIVVSPLTDTHSTQRSAKITGRPRTYSTNRFHNLMRVTARWGCGRSCTRSAHSMTTAASSRPVPDQPGELLMEFNLLGIVGIRALPILEQTCENASLSAQALSAKATPRYIKNRLEAGLSSHLTMSPSLCGFSEIQGIALAFSAARVHHRPKKTGKANRT